MKPLIAICIGHSRLIGARREGGARSIGGVSEWDYNTDLAPMIAGPLSQRGIVAVIIDDYPGRGYGAAIRNLATRLRTMGVTHAVELHFNAASPRARGHEWLHWTSSRMGRRMAESLDREMRLAFPDLPARGAKPRGVGSRGAEFLRRTHCPAIIAEPFFGSNAEDWALAQHEKAKIASAIAAGIEKSVG